MKSILIVGAGLLFLLSLPSLKAATEEEKKAARKLNEEILFEKEEERREKEAKLPPPILDSSVDQLKQFFQTSPDLIKLKATPEKQGKCFQIFLIHLSGNSIFSIKKLENLYVTYLFRCIFKKDIDELLAKIRSFYQDRGYSLARVFLTEESNFVTGELFIEILEGKIQKIQVKGNQKRKNKFRRKTAFPFLEGDVFNIYDIEQGLKQINRLRFSQARMQIIPAKERGFSNIDIILNKEKYTYISLGISSIEKLGIGGVYGKYNYNSSFGLEDVLGMNESLSFSYNRSQKDSFEDNLFSRSYSSNISFPLGYYTISSSYSGSSYSQPQVTRAQEFISKGDSDNVNLSLEKIILKKKGNQVALKASAGTQKNRVFVDTTLVDVSSRKLATANLSLIGNFTIKKNSLQSALTYRQGVTWFGAREDALDIKEDEPHAQYSFWSNNTSYSISFIKNFPVNYTTRIYSQTTDKEIYGTIGIGGSGSVRGYASNSYSDDIGWYQQHTISTHPFQKLSFLGSFAKALKFSLFYDYGCVESSAGARNYRCLSGGGTSLNFSYKWINFSYSYEIPNDSTTPFTTKEPIVKRMSASLLWDFGF